MAADDFARGATDAANGRPPESESANTPLGDLIRHTFMPGIAIVDDATNGGGQSDSDYDDGYDQASEKS